MELVIVSGLSGAGKSRVAAVLEDMDFYCVDNMPVSLMPKFAELCNATGGKYERVALVTDVRTLDNFNDLFFALDELSEYGIEHKIIFVEAQTNAIVKRYKETRRRHPLMTDGVGIIDAVNDERERLSRVRENADFIINTTDLTLGRLQRKLFMFFNAGSSGNEITVNMMSFGYKYGVPIEADLVFDVRFLPNPFYVAELKNKTGLDKDVRDYIFENGQTGMFFEKLKDLMAFLMPNYVEEGKRNLIVCVGCTGGHHRSVAIASALGEYLTELGYYVEYKHRDIEKS